MTPPILPTLAVAAAATALGCTAPGPGLPHGAAAADCATCHLEQHAQWSASPHARSDRSPLLLAMLDRVEEAWGAAAREACVACHSPGHGPDRGITCVSCHAAVGNTAEHSGRLVVDLEAPLAGPLDDPLATEAHGSRPGELLRSPSLCGTCHEVRGPRLFVEPTLTEYRDSGLGEVGIGCVECHMPRLDDAPLVPGGPPRPRRSHRFAAFEAPQLDEALTLWVRTAGPAPVVVVENTGAGHAVPTGISFVRDIWVDVRVTDAHGATRSIPRVVELGSRPMREDRPVALPTEADRIDHRTLAPGAQLTRAVDLPADLEPPLTIEAVVRARPVRPEVLEALGLAHPEAPPLEVERVEATLP